MAFTDFTDSVNSTDFTSEHFDNWTELAACGDHDPELFFPLSDVGPGARQVQRAKAVCAGCPVRARCLSYALDHGLDHGIFGGATERERRALKRTAATPHAA